MSQPFKMDEIQDDTYIERSGPGAAPALIALVIVAIVCVLSFAVAQHYLGAPPPEEEVEELAMPEGESEIVTLTEENFVDSVGEGVVLVDFWRYDCYWCDKLLPVLERFARENKGKITVAKVNCSEHPTFARKFDIEGYPKMILFRDGEALTYNDGYLNDKELRRFVADALAKPVKKEKATN